MPRPKICKGCGQSLLATTEYFYEQEKGKDGLNAKCKQCERKRSRKYAISDKGKKVRKEYVQSEHGKAENRKLHLKHAYNITDKQHLQMYTDQDGCCKICKKAMPYSEIVTDHDHKTGKVRGLLCSYCNIRLRSLDDSDFLQAAVIYLGGSK